VTDQIVKIGIGFVLMVIAASVDYRVYFRVASPIYGVGLGLVVLATIVGVTTNSATRWLDLGFLRFQPSELMKLTLVVGLARLLHVNAARKKRKPLITMAMVAVMVMVPAALIVRQPDLSTGIMLVLIAGSILAVTELNLKAIALLIAGGIASFMLAWVFVLQDYQSKRISVWLDPEAHPDGAYQVLQARTAVGNGQFLGRGVYQGTQNRLDFVPYSESDFSFAVFAEEWGFVGSTIVLLLFLSLVLWSINLASQARDRFSAVLCVGVGAMVFWHVLLNVGVVLGLFPNTGLPLPFFSHGGSNVVTMMLGFGVLISVSRSRKWR
jgi:rod shape determining protein RodA